LRRGGWPATWPHRDRRREEREARARRPRPDRPPPPAVGAPLPSPSEDPASLALQLRLEALREPSRQRNFPPRHPATPPLEPEQGLFRASAGAAAIARAAASPIIQCLRSMALPLKCSSSLALPAAAGHSQE